MFQEKGNTEVYGFRPFFTEFKEFIEKSRPNHDVEQRHIYPILVTFPYCYIRGWAYEDITWNDISRAKRQGISTEEPLYSMFMKNEKGEIHNPLPLEFNLHPSYMPESSLIIDWDALGLTDSLTMSKLEELFCKKTQALCLTIRDKGATDPDTLEGLANLLATTPQKDWKYCAQFYIEGGSTDDIQSCYYNLAEILMTIRYS
jgi:hypothetical protein